MPDDVVDTTQVPADGAGPTEPTDVPDDTPTDTPADVPVDVPPDDTPTYITADHLAEALETQRQSQQSWQGRRDKDLIAHIGTVINERLTANQNQPSPEDMSSKLLDNPRDVIRSEMDAYNTERTTKETTHFNTAMETVGNLMETDPLYTDKDLGGEVVAEVKRLVQTGKILTNIAPADAGKIMLGDALSNVIRTRQGVKTNPLGGNTPQNTTGSLNAPSTPAAPKVKVPKLDALTEKMAKKWGYKDEDLSQLYGE
jgi:hypothetical protein